MNQGLSLDGEGTETVYSPVGRKISMCVVGYYLRFLASSGGLWNLSLADKEAGSATVINCHESQSLNCDKQEACLRIIIKKRDEDSL